MTPPRRLAEAGTEFEREVLLSARLDAGHDDGLKRTLVAMGVGAATVSATAPAAGAGMLGGTVAAAAGGPATVLAGAGVGVLVKWIGVAVVVVGAGAALSAVPLGDGASAAKASRALQPTATRLVVPQSARRSVAESVAATVTPATAWTSPPPAPPVPGVGAGATSHGAIVRSAPRPAVPDESSPSKSAAVLDPARVAASPDAPSPPLSPAPTGELRRPSSLEVEVAKLDRVRALLAACDASRALRELDAYDQAFPESVLADEATVLRVDALVAQGDRAAASAVGRRFLTANPASPHAPRLRQVLSDVHNP